MHLRVLGCHGGETRTHKTSAFVLDGVLGIDAGATAEALTLEEQLALRAVVVSHAHMDHVRDLASLADNRCQGATQSLVVAGTAFTLQALRAYFFNNVLWPDFSAIPLVADNQPTLRFVELAPETETDIAGYTVQAVMVHHTIESAGFVISRAGSAIGYSGDTGPTDRYWEVLARRQDVKALLQEISFPNAMAWLAGRSGHHTPATAVADIRKLGRTVIPVLAYHVKPSFQAQVEAEIAAVREVDIQVLSLGDSFVIPSSQG